MLSLANLKKASGSTHKRKRIGRGKGSGHGNLSTRGLNGQCARAGSPHPYEGFEGGQMRLTRILPKRGFVSPHRVVFSVVNLASLDVFEAGTKVTPEMLCDKGLVKNLTYPVKILARGEITKSLTIVAHQFSDSARAKIEKAGGKAEVI